MISERQEEIIQTLNNYLPHWDKWYRWEESPFSIREMELVEYLFVKKLPLKAVQQARTCTLKTVKRNVESFMEKLSEPEVMDNYSRFVETRIDTVPVPSEQHRLFMEWLEAYQENSVKLLEKRLIRKAISS